jgi:hypothetical protein
MDPTFFFNLVGITVIDGHIFVKGGIYAYVPYKGSMKQYLLDYKINSVEMNNFDEKESSKVALSEFVQDHQIEHFVWGNRELLDYSLLDILDVGVITRFTYTHDIIDLDRLPPQLCIQLEMLKCHTWTGDLRNLFNLCVLDCSIMGDNDVDQLANIIHLKVKRWKQFASEKLETLTIDETHTAIVDLDQFPNLTKVESHTSITYIKFVRTLSEPLEFLSSKTIPDFSVLNLSLHFDTHVLVDGKGVFDRVPGLRKLTILTPTSITDYGNDDSLVNLL